MFEQYMKSLTKASLFRGFKEIELTSLMDCLCPKVIAIKKNESIAMTGEIFDSIGIILTGGAAVYRENAAGDRILITLLGAGDMFGEMLAFSNTRIWPVTVIVQEDCEVLFLGREKIVGECDRMCPWHRSLIGNMLKILSEKALFLNKRVEYLSIKSMRGKIATYLLEQSKKAGSALFMLPMSRSDMADYLNVSRPSMSREMARMKDEGIIDYHLATIQIKDLHVLKNMLNT